jgi:hypothetical protein
MVHPKIDEVLIRHSPQLMKHDAVIGIYQDVFQDGSLFIKIIVSKRTPKTEELLPDSLEGYPVILEEAKKIRTLPKED